MSEYEKLKSMNPSFSLASKIPIVSVDVLPPNAKYLLIDMISFQSTLGTGLFSEFGSEFSNIFGTEAKMMNAKIETSIGKCKDAMRVLAHQIGANAVIGADFDFSTNTRDATTVAAQGTAVFIENIDEVFKGATSVTYDGTTDLAEDGYKIWLTQQFKIKKNDALGGLICDSKIFQTIEAALAYADASYKAKLVEEQYQAEQRRKHANDVIETGKSSGREWTKYGDGTYEIRLVSGGKKRFVNLAELENYIKN
jgi:uncharacterized protein YbjQ (UPF0145 family)